MTPEHIELHARRRPRAPAVVHDGREISYAELARNLRQCVRALYALGVSRAERVAVGCEDIYRHWLILLALESLGAVSASLTDRESDQGNDLLARSDRVLAEQAFDPRAVKWQHRLTEQWMDGVLAAGEAPLDGLPVLAGDDPARISRTSGTTGRQKLIVLDRRVREARVAQWAEFLELDEAARFLLPMPMTATLAYHQANACAQRGGTLVISQSRGAKREILDGAVTHAFFLPGVLSQLTDMFPARPGKPLVLRVFSGGAAVSRGLLDKTLQRLAALFADEYGCNEVSFVSTGAAHDPGGFGRIWPGVQVEVVDEQDLPVPVGRLGRIRIRSSCMVTGYLDDPRASAEFFRNGWFYPGDLGEMRAGGELRLLGRNNDVFNIGGTKIAADRVEDLARRALGAGDVAACSIPGLDGIGEIWIAVSGSVGEEALAQARERLQKAYRVRCHLVRIAAIPRNDMGKIARASIQRAIVDSQARLQIEPEKAAR